jgi:GNAT superfamily N-acetyltransferase
MTVDVRYDLTDDELSDFVTLYGDYEWWADRDHEAIARAVAGTDALVCLADSDTDELVASARVLTDFVYYATVYDVIVAAERRGEGLGRRVMDAVVDHPDLQDLDRLSLFCRKGLESFYEECGFVRASMRAPIPERDGEERELIRMVYERERSTE